MNFTIREAKAGLAMLALAILPASAAFSAPIISLTGPTTASKGSQIIVNVVGTGFTDLFAYQFDVKFNPALFQARGVTEGPFLATAGTTFFDGGSTNNVTGVTSFVFDSVIGGISGANGSGVLARLTFDTIGAFSSIGTFTLDNVTALDSAINSISVGTSSLQIAAVPEPATVALMFAGLGVIAVGRNRRKKLAAKGMAIEAA